MVKLTSVCIVIALVALEDLYLFPLDVVTAVLDGDLSDDDYSEQPPRFEVGDTTKVVCKLVKALYSLKKPLCNGISRLNLF